LLRILRFSSFSSGTSVSFHMDLRTSLLIIHNCASLHLKSTGSSNFFDPRIGQ
jgi:hypothetical protein